MYSPNIAYINAGGNLMPPESSEVIYGVLKQSQGMILSKITLQIYSVCDT